MRRREPNVGDHDATTFSQELPATRAIRRRQATGAILKLFDGAVQGDQRESIRQTDQARNLSYHSKHPILHEPKPINFPIAKILPGQNRVWDRQHPNPLSKRFRLAEQRGQCCIHKHKLHRRFYQQFLYQHGRDRSCLPVAYPDNFCRRRHPRRNRPDYPIFRPKGQTKKRNRTID